MESAWVAAKSTFRKHCATCANKLKRWSLKQMRNLLWAADDWLMAQERKFREESARKERIAEVDPIASAIREKALIRRAPLEGAEAVSLSVANHKPILHAPSSRARRLPRLKYERGEFVRQGGN